MTLDEAKAAARQAAFARRKTAHGQGLDPEAQARLSAYLAPFAGRALAGYMPIRTEIDPVPVMASWPGPVAVPVIVGPGQPLRFCAWHPGTAMIEGSFGARVPDVQEDLVPEVLIVPLVAFDRSGTRLGYGGGYYDRTLAVLRSRGPVHAVGFAYSAQAAEILPRAETDVRLDAVLTEREIVFPGS